MPSRIGKIQSAWTATGSTLYAIIRNAIAEAWNVGGAAFEAFNVANWSQYAVPMTEQGALSQFYVADLPAGAESYYTATVYEQAGVGPAVADTLVEVVRAVQLADDVPQGGTPGSSTATLALQKVKVSINSGAPAVQFSNTIGSALIMDSSSGDAVSISSNSGNGLAIQSNTGAGLSLFGAAALSCQASGDAAPCILLSTFSALASAGVIAIISSGNSPGISVIGAGTAPAVQLGDGINGGVGLKILAGDPASSGVSIIGGNAGNGVDIFGDVVGLNIAAFGGIGCAINGTDSGLFIQGQNDPAVQLIANTTVAITVTTSGILDAVQVNGQSSVDQFGRQRILSSLTNGFGLLAFPFVMTDLAGNPMTGLTITSTVILDGAASVPTVNSPVEVGNGVYAIDLDASDRAGTTMMLRFTAPNARDLDIAIINTA